MKIFPIVLTTLVLLYSFAGLKAQMVTYSGPVEYYLEITKVANGGGTNDGYNWNVSVDEKRIIKGSFYVTFTGSANSSYGFSMFTLTSIEENIEFTNTVNNEGNEQKISQSCLNDLMQYSHTATPGDSRTSRTAVNTTRVNPDESIIKAGFIQFKDKEYSLYLAGKLKVNIQSEIFSEETYPCLNKNNPPTTMSSSTIFDFPISISATKKPGNVDYLEGVHVQDSTISDECGLCMPPGSNIGQMVHGDMDCSYVSKITTSWMLVKRSTECDANVTYVKGDVKINGVPAEKGEINIGAGDLIETGSKSRIELRSSNGSTYRLGSKSKLTLNNPCELENEKPKESNISATLIKGKLYYLLHKLVGKESYYDPRMRTAVIGVRGNIRKLAVTFYASTNPDFGSYLFQQEDEEKVELIEGFENLPDNVSAYYIHFEDDEVKDISALKGTLKIEDSYHIKNKTITEGTTTNKWDNGTIMRDLVISVK